MTHYKVTCDVCEKDLTETWYEWESRVVLQCEPRPRGAGGSVMGCSFGDRFPAMHFCDLNCLKKWFESGMKPRR